MVAGAEMTQLQAHPSLVESSWLQRIQVRGLVVKPADGRGEGQG